MFASGGIVGFGVCPIKNKCENGGIHDFMLVEYNILGEKLEYVKCSKCNIHVCLYLFRNSLDTGQDYITTIFN